MAIILGSKAMLFQTKQTSNERFLKSDYDVIMTPDEFEYWTELNEDAIISIYPTGENKFKAKVGNDRVSRQYEIEVGFKGTSAEFLLIHWRVTTQDLMIGFFGELYAPLTLEYLALTKRSHLIYPVHFEKNMDDYHSIKSLFNGGFEIDAMMQEYYNLRSQEAKERYKQRTPNLNVTIEDFFSSKLPVKTVFVHDHIHQVMAHYDKPVYSMMQPDPNKAWCDKDMFFDLPFEYRIQCIQEEAYVIALERYIIPQYQDDWNDYFVSYKKAVKRICTTLTSGWFRDFAIENYPKVIEWYNPKFVEKFAMAIRSGDIKIREGRVWETPLPELGGVVI